MDPNAALSEALTLANEIGTDPDADAREAELAERVSALDEWIRKGRFLPSAWARAQVPDELAQRIEQADELAARAIELRRGLRNWWRR